MKYSQHVDHVMWSLLEHMYDMYPAQGGTHKQCGQSSGRGKNHVCTHMGEGGFRAGVLKLWTSTFLMHFGVLNLEIYV